MSRLSTSVACRLLQKALLQGLVHWRSGVLAPGDPVRAGGAEKISCPDTSVPQIPENHHSLDHGNAIGSGS